MDPMTIKGVWGFNGTERPGAVYLAAVLAGHAQKGLPAFGIYGRDVQSADATEIPADVREKLLRGGLILGGRIYSGGNHAGEVLSADRLNLYGNRGLHHQPGFL